MSRTDRLLSLMQLMRDGRLHRAEDLARTLGVSVRTIYRDMEVLTQSGIPVEGERGLGYQITAAITLPPLNLSKLELEALHLGLAIVGDGADADLQAAAKSLSAKVDAVLPEDGTARPRGFGFAVYPLSGATRGFDHMPAMRAAIRTRQKLRVSYPGADGVPLVGEHADRESADAGVAADERRPVLGLVLLQCAGIDEAREQIRQIINERTGLQINLDDVQIDVDDLRAEIEDTRTEIEENRAVIVND